MSNGFVKIDNSIVDNQSLSFDAKGVYMILVRYYSIPNFKINKTHIKSVTGLGEIRFNRAWKELKEKGLLIQKKKSVEGRFTYEYILKTTESKKATKLREEKPTAPVEEKQKHVDSDGNTPIKGQISLNDVLEDNQEESVAGIERVTKETGFNDVQAKELLKAARDNVTRILESYNYVMQQKGIKNIYAYTKWAVKNNKTLNVKSGPYEKPKDSFNDYEQRTYDYVKLEMALLYGEQYDLPV